MSRSGTLGANPHTLGNYLKKVVGIKIPNTTHWSVAFTDGLRYFFLCNVFFSSKHSNIFFECNFFTIGVSMYILNQFFVIIEKPV